MAAPGPRSTASTIVSLAWPLIALRVMSVGMYVVDAIVCGQLEDPPAKLAGLAIAFQIGFVFDTLVLGLIGGAIGLVSRARGADDHERMRLLVAQSSRLVVASALAIAVVANLIARPAISLFDDTPSVVDSALAYLRPLMAASAATYLAAFYGAVCTSTRDTRTPMLFGALGSAVNLALTYGLGLGAFGLPALGVTGIALGTVAANVIMTVLLAHAVHRKRMPIALSPLGLERASVRTIAKVGVPGAIDLTLQSVHAIAMVAIFSELALAAVAAHGIGMRVQMVINLPAGVYGSICAVLVGAALGARNVDRARAVARSTLWLGVGTMAVLGTALFVFAEPLAGVFGVPASSPVYTFAVDWLRMVAVGGVPIAVHFARAGTMTGAGATAVNLRISVASIAFQLPLAWLLAFPLGLGPLGVWAALLAAYGVRAVLAELVYHRGRWAAVGSSL